MEIKHCQSLRPYTTLGIGGRASILIEVRTISEMGEAIRYAQFNKLPMIVLGKGSNTLLNDADFNGCAIINKIDFFHSPSSGVFEVGAGYSFSLLGTQTAKQGWKGLEFACGIPGSVGGAVFMNAGANGAETADAVKTVEWMDFNGEIHLFQRDELTFDYRTSPFQKMEGIIVSTIFQLQPCNEVRERQRLILNYRMNTQPYSSKSAGCFFRNPSETPHSAGALIEMCGLKGMSIGGAQVSPVHANFLINTGEATTEEMLSLVKHVQAEVKKQFGIALQLEVRLK